MSDASRTNVSQHAAVLMGQSPPSASCSETGEGLPFIQGNAEFGARYPIPRLRCSAPTRIAEAGDLLLSVRAPVGELNQATERTVIGRGLAALRFSSDARDFAWHAVKWSARRLDRVAQGSTFVAVSRKDVEGLAIPWHGDSNPLISGVLDSVDDTIAKAQAIVAKLRKVRAGLLYDLLTRGIDESGHLRDPIAHPDHFQDSPLGRLPRAWETEKLGRLTTRIVDGVHHTPRYVDRGVPFLTAENLTKGPGISIDPCRFVTEQAHAEYKLRADVRAGHVLVSKDGTLGVARVVPEGLPEFSIFVSVALLCPKPSVIAAWLVAEFFETRWFFRQLGYLSAGTGLKHIHLEHFREFLLPVPPMQEQHRISEAIGTIDTVLAADVLKLGKLANVRLGVTNDLLTGLVRVPEPAVAGEAQV